MNTIGLMGLTEEISRHPSISCVMWLLMITFMQICNKRISKAEQGKIQSVRFEEKGGTKKYTVKNRSSNVQGDKEFKERLDAK